MTLFITLYCSWTWSGCGGWCGCCKEESVM